MKLASLTAEAMRTTIAAEIAAERDALRQAILSGPVCYLRFGSLPVSGRSRNVRDGRDEAGISCYAGYVHAGTFYLALWGRQLENAGRLAATRPAFLLRGRLLLGIAGGDEEPLMADARLGRRIKKISMMP